MPPLGMPTRFGWLSFLSPLRHRIIHKHNRSIRLFMCSDWWYRKKSMDYVTGGVTRTFIEVRVMGFELAWSR